MAKRKRRSISVVRITEDKLDTFAAACARFSIATDEAHAREFIASDSTAMIVALDGDAVIGAVVAYVIPGIDGRQKMIVDRIAVLNSYSDRQVCRNMIAELLEIALERGCNFVEYNRSVGDEHLIDDCAYTGGKTSDLRTLVRWDVHALESEKHELRASIVS